MLKRAVVSRLAARFLREQNFSVESVRSWMRFVGSISVDFEKAIGVFEHAKSQNGQDLFALAASGFKEGGYFVEIGATDGVSLSNTYILEKRFGWEGLLAEPARTWQRNLRKNRHCDIDFRAVWKDGGQQLPFVEDSVLSSLKLTSGRDFHTRLPRKTYDVTTVAPEELLREYSVPQFIDFLSIDTEGSELEILQNFPFGAYEVNSICVEHNYSGSEIRISRLLQDQGYIQFAPEISGIDSWWLRSGHHLLRKQ